VTYNHHFLSLLPFQILGIITVVYAYYSWNLLVVLSTECPPYKCLSNSHHSNILITITTMKTLWLFECPGGLHRKPRSQPPILRGRTSTWTGTPDLGRIKVVKVGDLRLRRPLHLLECIAMQTTA